MTMPIGELVLLATSLFSIFSPPAAIGPIATVSGEYPPPAQRRMAIQVAVSYAVVLVIAAWVGQWLLEILGVTIAGLTATGGLALLLAGLPLMLEGRKRQPTEEQVEEAGQERDWRSVIIVPLTFPLSVGGATAAIVITSASRYDSVPDLLAISAVCLLMAIVVGLTTCSRRLSPSASARRIWTS